MCNDEIQNIHLHLDHWFKSRSGSGSSTQIHPGAQSANHAHAFGENVLTFSYLHLRNLIGTRSRPLTRPDALSKVTRYRQVWSLGFSFYETVDTNFNFIHDGQKFTFAEIEMSSL